MAYSYEYCRSDRVDDAMLAIPQDHFTRKEHPNYINQGFAVRKSLYLVLIRKDMLHLQFHSVIYLDSQSIKKFYMPNNNC